MKNLSPTTDNFYQLLNTEETAKLLGVTPGTLVVWRSTGRYKLPYVKVGRRVMYDAKDIKTFVQQRTVLHTGIVLE